MIPTVRAVCLAALLITCSSPSNATPEKQITVTEDFVGSTAEGSVFYTIKSVHEGYEEWDADWAKAHSIAFSVQRHQLDSTGKFTTQEFPSFRIDNNDKLEIYQNAALKADDLVTSGTSASFVISPRGLAVVTENHISLMMDLGELKQLLGSNYLGAIYRYAEADRSEKYFYLTIRYQTGGSTTVVVPLESSRVERALKQAKEKGLENLLQISPSREDKFWDERPSKKAEMFVR